MLMKNIYKHLASICLAGWMAASACASPPSSALTEFYSIGPISGSEAAINSLQSNTDKLVSALESRKPRYSFFENWCGRDDSKVNPQDFQFFFDQCKVEVITPEDSGSKGQYRYHARKYYFPTGEQYLLVRLPFTPNKNSARAKNHHGLEDRQPNPILWLFVSKSGRVCSFW